MGRIFNVSAACKPELHYMVNMEEQLKQIKAMVDQGVRRTSELIGMGCAGIIIGGIGIGGALFVDAVTFLISGLLLSFLKVNEEKGEAHGFQMKGYLGTLREGFTYFRTSQLAVMVCAVCVAQNLCTLPIENLQAAYVGEYLGLDVFAIRELYLLTGILSIALFLLMNRSKRKR